MKPELRCAVTMAAAIACAAPAAAQGSKSPALVAELVQQLEQHKIQAVAAKDPDRPGTFVAASYVPGVQLLVVCARSTAPDYIEYVLGASKYDEVYASLNGASENAGKLFVQDMGANGLAPKPENGGPIDIAYRDVNTMTVFNGDWKRQGLSEKDYGAAFQVVDTGYAKALSLLIRQLKPPSRP